MPTLSEPPNDRHNDGLSAAPPGLDLLGEPLELQSLETVHRELLALETHVESEDRARLRLEDPRATHLVPLGSKRGVFAPGQEDLERMGAEDEVLTGASVRGGIPRLLLPDEPDPEGDRDDPDEAETGETSVSVIEL